MAQPHTVSQLGEINAKISSAKNKRIYRWHCGLRSNFNSVRLYIVSLHRRIRKLLKTCQKYRKKMIKIERAFRKTTLTSTTTHNTSSIIPTAESKKLFIDDIKNAALDAQNHMGFIYEPTSGLYYDSQTGYYYNAEHGLYYDGDNGCYYSYNNAEKKFEFHSQVCLQGSTNTTSDTNKIESKRQQDTTTSSTIEILHRTQCEEIKEDGELSDDNEGADDGGDSATAIGSAIQSPPRLFRSKLCDTDDDNSSSAYSESDRYSDIAKNYPPSLRIIVQETNLKKLKLGELFLITYKGGTLGREGKNDVIIPELVCSKYHLKFSYDIGRLCYTCVDLGSRNGTILDGQRMSNTKQESDPITIAHGSILQIGQTKLLCHVHDGRSTCDHCEPGLVQNGPAGSFCNVNTSKTYGYTQLTGLEAHKKQLKTLKKRYGLQDNKYEKVAMDPKADRAKHRRKQVGSSCEYEKTEIASLETSIPSSNKGFKMLSNLGWNEGQSLGKHSDGILEPIEMENNQSKKGLGCEKTATTSYISTNQQNQKSRILVKTYERYKSSQVLDLFEDYTKTNK